MWSGAGWLGEGWNKNAFSPARIPGLELWLAADGVVLNGSSVQAADGDAVATWQDNSGNARHATQVTSGNRPVFRANKLGGKPSLQFTRASNHYLNNAYTGEPMTVFVVGQCSEAITTNCAFLGGQGNGAVAIGAYYFKCAESVAGANSFTRAISTDTTGAAWTTANRYNPNLTTQSGQSPWYIQAGRQNGNDIELWFNGTRYSKNTNAGASSKQAITAAAIGGAWYTNSLSASGGNWFGGFISEILIYSGTLTVDQMEAISNYLGAKYWSIPASVKYVMWSFEPSGTTMGTATTYYPPRLFTVPADGFTFTEHTYPSLITQSGALGGARDAHLFYWNGYYYCAYTTIGFGDGTSFDISRSKSPIGPFGWWATVDCSSVLAGAAHPAVWSPIFFGLPGDTVPTICVSIAPDSTAVPTAFKQYVVQGSFDLSTWGAPTEITGIAASLSNTISGWFRKNGSNFECWVKDETAKKTYVFTSSSRFTGYTQTRQVTELGTNAYEGANLVSRGGSNVRIYADNLGPNGVSYADSSDNGLTFGTISTLTVSPASPVVRNAIMYDFTGPQVP